MPRENIIDKSLYDTLTDNFHSPPGKDPSLGNFYGAVIQMADDGEHVAYMLATVKRQRPDLTDKHLVNLLFRAVQAIKFAEGDFTYREFRETSQWKSELERICTDRRLSRQLGDTLRHRSTNTTIYQRYTGPYAVIAHLFDGNSTSIADLGCGGNYGLRGIELFEPFQTINDETPGKYIASLLSYRINLRDGLAVDKEDPDTEENRKWRLACSFYPQELDKLSSIQEFEDRIRESRKIRFLQTDLLTCTRLPENMYDGVILSTILYQLQRSDQAILMKKARKMLKEKGIIIVQDFAARDPEHHNQLDFSESWFGTDFTYCTFIAGKYSDQPFLEALKWNNGRCKTVRAGDDFDTIFRTDQSSLVSATLAHSTS